MYVDVVSLIQNFYFQKRLEQSFIWTHPCKTQGLINGILIIRVRIKILFKSWLLLHQICTQLQDHVSYNNRTNVKLNLPQIPGMCTFHRRLSRFVQVLMNPDFPTTSCRCNLPYSDCSLTVSIQMYILYIYVQCTQCTHRTLLHKTES